MGKGRRGERARWGKEKRRGAEGILLKKSDKWAPQWIDDDIEYG
jgi:hypothetical protein